jgi:hypothetical protein
MFFISEVEMKDDSNDTDTGGTRKVEILLDAPLGHDPLVPDLMSRGFIRAPTVEAATYDFVQAGWKESGYEEDFVMLQYLGKMVEYYLNKTDIFTQLLAYSYLRHVLSPTAINRSGLKEIADLSLLSVTLFSGRLLYRHFSLSEADCIDLGVGMFHELAEREGETCDRDAYVRMSDHFMVAMAVLRAAEGRRGEYGERNGLSMYHMRNAERLGVSMNDAVNRFREMYLAPDPDGLMM